MDEDTTEPKTFREMAKVWPKSTFLIILNELCERFSYYGMRAVLTLYLLNFLGFSNNTATIFFHAFNVVSHITPLFGSILADGFIGRFRTIFVISIVYTCGQIILAMSSASSSESSLHPWLDLAGLLIIAIGTGGIKPCVSAFGGDQFNPTFVAMISVYFSVFYFTINVGTTVSSFISPIFRTKSCLGHDNCYPLAFGIPALLMILSIIIFALGSPFYTKLSPHENAIGSVYRVIKEAIKNKLENGNQRKNHWLEYAIIGHKCENEKKCAVQCYKATFINDVKCLIRITVMMMPFPFFWSLFDQQGSRWVIQAISMDSQISKNISLLPDQMGTLNSVLVLIFIPLFQTVIYPFIEKIGISTTPCRRMVVGGFLAAAAYAICGFVQLKVNQTLPDIPNSSTAFLSVVNTDSFCEIEAKLAGFSESISEVKTILPNSSLIENRVDNVFQLFRVNLDPFTSGYIKIRTKNQSCRYLEADFKTNLAGGETYVFTVTKNGHFIQTADTKKPHDGNGRFSIGASLDISCWNFPRLNGTECKNGQFSDYFALCVYNKECDPKIHNEYVVWKNDKKTTFFLEKENGAVVRRTRLEPQNVKPGTYKLHIVKYLHDDKKDKTPSKNEIITAALEAYVQVKRMGGVYCWTLSSSRFGALSTNLHEIVPPNHVSILWQMPQYAVITAAEVLFSVTGYEFAYAQSAKSLRSVVSAIWLFTQAIGDSIIIIINAMDLFDNSAVEMFTYAVIMVVVICGFMLLSIFYYEYKTIEVETCNKEHA